MKINTFYGVSVAFYPEHFDRKYWEQNISLIKETGMNVVRIGEFCWDMLEIEEGKYSPEWLNELFHLFEKYDIKVIMCTPTAASPYWVCEKYPETLPVAENGSIIGFGGRRHTCPSSPKYRELCQKITAWLTKHFGQNKQIIAWHIDNELGHPDCYCEQCSQAFKKFLKHKFNTIEALNQTLVSTFWSQTYRAFDEVSLPTSGSNPGLQFLYRKFISELWVDYFCNQKEVITNAGCIQPITTNMMPPWYGYDHYQMGENEDIICYDTYPVSHPFGFCLETMAFFAAQHRGFKGDRNFWIMEMQTGSMYSTMLQKGELKYYTMAHFALGANLINYFRWDMPGNGSERLNQAIVHPAGGKLKNYDEIKHTAGEINGIAEMIEGTEIAETEIAIVFDFPSWWSDLAKKVYKTKNLMADFGTKKLLEQIEYPYLSCAHFKALMQNGFMPDVISVNSDLSKYRLIITPALHCIDDSIAEKLTDFVQNGGTLICNTLTGVMDENAKLSDCLPPGKLAGLFGVEVTDWGCNPCKDKLNIMLEDISLEVSQWLEVLRPLEGTETLGRFNIESFSEYAPITINKTGGGNAIYLSSELSPPSLSEFYRFITSSIMNLQSEIDCQDGVYRIIRKSDSRELNFIINSSNIENSIHLEGSYLDVIHNIKVSNCLKLKPFEVVCLTGH